MGTSKHNAGDNPVMEQLVGKEIVPSRFMLKAETHDAANRGDKSPRLHCCCNKSHALILLLRYVPQIQTSLNLCDRLQRQNSVTATMSHEAICCSNLSRRRVASCASALKKPTVISCSLVGLVGLMGRLA